jgi:hypothetical protein
MNCEREPVDEELASSREFEVDALLASTSKVIQSIVVVFG